MRSDAARGDGIRLVVCDATSDGDLLALGRAADGMPLVTGGSGVAMGLPENFRRAGLLSGERPAPAAPAGRAVALSGSCSGATRRQVARHAATMPVFTVDGAALARGEDLVAEALAWIDAQGEARLPLVSSSVDPQTLRDNQTAGGVASAAVVEHFFAMLATALVQRGVVRLIVAGGETSSAVVSALGVDTLEIGPEIDPGVPALVATGARPLCLALKSGNFGAEDFFLKALGLMDEMR